MVDVFDEVEEELRSERYKRLARTWLPVVGGLLVLALIAALAWWGWQSWQTRKADAASVSYQAGLDALEANDPAAATTAFQTVVDEGNGAYKALALMQQAQAAIAADDIDEAVTLFDEAARATRDPIIADPARLKAVYLLMDTAPLADIESRLEPLVAEDRPLRALAQEAQAMARLQAGQTAQAREVFVLLQFGQDLPDSVRQRAQAAISAIDTGTAAAIPEIIKAQAALPTPSAAPAPAGNAPAPTPAPAG